LKATKIVYGLITILVLIPILVKRIKGIKDAAKSNDRVLVNKQFIYLIIGCSIVLSLTISLYSFTIKHQAPLVAEQINDIFMSCAKEGLSQADFENVLYDKKLASSLETVKYDSILESIDPQTSYDVYLSERVYKIGDKYALYCKYIRDDEIIYLEIGLKQSDNKWELATFETISEEQLAKIDSKMEFFKIN